MDGTATVIPRREKLNIISVSQLDKDSILICYDNVVKIITPQGKLRVNKKQVSELTFDFNINSISEYKKLCMNLCWFCFNLIIITENVLCFFNCDNINIKVIYTVFFFSLPAR